MATINYYRSPAQFTNPGCVATEGSKLRRMSSKLSSVVTATESIPADVTAWLTTGWKTAAPIPNWDASGVSLQNSTWKKFANEAAWAVKYGRVSDKTAFQVFLTEVGTIGAGTAAPAVPKTATRTRKAPASQEPQE